MIEVFAVSHSVKKRFPFGLNRITPLPMADVKNDLAFRSVGLALLQQGLRDDGWEFDWTTLGSVSDPDARIEGRIVAKSEGVWAGSAIAAGASELGLTVKVEKADGDRLRPGDRIAVLSGPARSLLAVERPLLNLVSYASGIATRTRALVELARKACPQRPPRVASTRKTLPGYRDLAIYGVMVGGGSAHRLSLSGGVLIKENHIAAAGGIERALSGVRKVAPHGLRLEIEVRNLGELEQALKNGAEVVLLDNFEPAQVREALKIVEKRSPRPIVEVSGGLNEGNLASFALEGVDVLSLGSLTLSVTVVDLSFLVGK
jgi:nicotinate-nucleotide pyrophosphorylase (carboxylating)